MAREIKLGAPSLTGKGAALVMSEFGGTVYPINVEITNHNSFDVSIPELGEIGVLRSVFFENNGGNKRKSAINDADQFVRLASTLEQISELNNLKHIAFTISEVESVDLGQGDMSESTGDGGNGGNPEDSNNPDQNSAGDGSNQLPSDNSGNAGVNDGSSGDNNAANQSAAHRGRKKKSAA